MAGAGYKLFNTGDVLTAAQVNTYLQEQSVMRFANAAARTTALSTVLAEGMVSYLQDTDAVEVYNGTAWVSVAAGDITAVTAGTGLSGGGTTGAVTLNLSTPVSATNGGTAQTTYATGDLLYASASNTLAKRAIGTTGQVLTVSGGVPTWATPAGGGGKVLQVVQATTSTLVNVQSTSYTDSGLSASITPSAATSKILVLVSQPISSNRDATELATAYTNLVRGSTQIAEYPSIAWFRLGASADTSYRTFSGWNYLDSPSTTSSVTYKTQGKLDTTANNASLRFQIASNLSQMVLMEIGA